MDKTTQIENNDKIVNSDKFGTHRGEFVPVTSDLLKEKKVTSYAEFIEDEDEEDDYTIEKYELKKAYTKQENLHIGSLLLYIICCQPDIKFIETIFEHSNEAAQSTPELVIGEKEFGDYFNSVEKVNNLIDESQFKIWKLRCKYQNEEITISGDINEVTITIKYSSEISVNVFPLLNKIENETWNYSNYDSGLIKKMNEWFKMSPKSAVKTLTEMEKHKDIFDEFIAGMSGESFLFKNVTISVEGFTAKQLYEEYPLSELGAYNYLKYLREDPVHALEDLKKGLPRY